MICNVKFFDDTTELQQITNRSEQELWDAGFNLDDMDWGFVSETEWDDDLWWESSDGYFMYHILTWMECHCVGYNKVELEGKWYYTLHHS